MQEREASVAFARGEITGSLLEWDPARSGWTVLLLSAGGKPIPLQNKRGRSIRLFKTSDAALRWCQRIGFGEVKINL